MKAQDNTEERKRKNRERTQRYRKNRMERMTEEERVEFWKKESERTTKARARNLKDSKKKEEYLQKERERKR